ncbi:MAG: arylsulfatase [Lentisphaerae bacterium]|jgi:arylsulfatase A-like enzyme|nr:arylsulfatase [Lentisphaerota bacterium]MBT4817282.1 arylsulfatase [Lentisphaerota bacterium]MBT5611576.1 arylsulfatase [Lentisphaerota bacterium]MBT7058834.1 arylsulfatase [Lentisphaerota bacterium]MBT7842335.1 arylsulfatase [Lentisphaerota bacterium]
MLRYCMTFSLGVALLVLSASAAERPNIVLIMCDDMGFSDIGCYGGEVQTPNLDRLASEGMRFTQFYNNAKCTTTRASLVTGLYPRRSKGGLLRRNMLTLGEALGKAGYRTALSGKWHLGRGATTHPHKRGFQEFYGLLDGCCNFFNPVQPDPPYKGARVRAFGQNDERIESFPADYYTTDAFTDHAIASMRTFAGEGKPFLLHLCYTAPHYPLHAKPEDIAKYVGKYREGWDVLRKERYERQKKMGLLDPEQCRLSGKDSRAYSWKEADHDFEDLRMAVYAAMIDSMDQNIGRLLRALGDLGIADNTVVMFLSDNGGCSEEPGGRNPSKRTPGPGRDYVAVGPAWGWAQNAPFRRYKSWVHEGGISTPFIVRWPGVVKPGAINRDVAHIIDIMPTFLDMAGASYPEVHNGQQVLPVEGRSFLPLLAGKTRPGHERLFWEWSGNRAIREADWKLVWDKTVKAWELYDLSVDRTEVNDLAARHPERVTRLSAAWFSWARDTGLRVRTPATRKKERGL